jgi:hypothetical protein
MTKNSGPNGSKQETKIKMFTCFVWLDLTREEHRLRMFDKKTPSRIFGPDETGSSRSMEKTA